MYCWQQLWTINSTQTNSPNRATASWRADGFVAVVLDGALPPLSVLRPSSGQPALSWSLVDFRRTYSLPTDDASQLADRLGPRLRLRSPYREHLAQAFARFYMRVGLPSEAADFETVAIG